MPTYSPYGYPDEEDDDEEDDDDDPDASHPGQHLRPSELPDEADVGDSHDDEIVPCPYCGKPVYEFADVCPHCRSFVTFGTGDGRKPRWLLVTGLVVLAVLVYEALRGARWF